MEYSLIYESCDSYLFTCNAAAMSLPTIINNLNFSFSNLSHCKFDKDYHLSSSNNSEVNWTTNISQWLNRSNKPPTLALDLFLSQTTKEEMDALLKQCSRKEKKLMELKTQLNGLKDNWHLSVPSITKFLVVNINPFCQFCKVIEDKIINHLLKPQLMTKSIEEVQANMVKMKNSKLFTLYYKILLKQSQKSIDYLYKYSNWFNSNTDNILNWADSFIVMITRIIKEWNIGIIAKIQENEVYKKYKKDYDLYSVYIEKTIAYYPIVKYWNNVPHSIIFSGFEDPVVAKQSENEFNDIKWIMSQCPQFEVLKDSFKERTFLKEALSMVFKRDFEIYKQMNARSNDWLFDYLLYDN